MAMATYIACVALVVSLLSLIAAVAALLDVVWFTNCDRRRRKHDHY